MRDSYNYTEFYHTSRGRQTIWACGSFPSGQVNVRARSLMLVGGIALYLPASLCDYVLHKLKLCRPNKLPSGACVKMNSPEQKMQWIKYWMIWIVRNFDNSLLNSLFLLFHCKCYDSLLKLIKLNTLYCILCISCAQDIKCITIIIT